MLKFQKPKNNGIFTGSYKKEKCTLTLAIPSLAATLDWQATSPLESVTVIPSISSTCLIRGMFT